MNKMKYYSILMIIFINKYYSISANVSLTSTSELIPESKSIDSDFENQFETELLCRGEWKSPQNCNNNNCDYKANWEYIDENDEIVFTISTKNRNKWTGIGFSENQAMPETDAILGLVEESGRFFLMDSWLRAYEAPPLDQSQNLYNMSAWRENGITTLRFFRKRITGDNRDFQFTDTNCPYLIFPVMGGVFNAVNKRIRKHEITPIISDNKVCIKSCKPSTTTTIASSTTTILETDYNDLNTKKSSSIDTISNPTLIPNLPKDNEMNNNLYKIELKFPGIWKPTFGQRNSPDYKTMITNIKNQMHSELSKSYPNFKSLRVIELTGVEEESNSIIANIELMVEEMSDSKQTSKEDETEKLEIPSLLSTALYSIISDELLGDLRVDPKYLMIVRKDENGLEDMGSATIDKETENNFFNDEQTKWIIIFVGIAALIGLVLIQAFCMLCRDTKNKERKPQNDKEMPNSHWKDYAAANARSGYSYDNYVGPDDVDNTIKSNGQNTGKLDKQNGNKQNSKNTMERMPPKFSNSVTLERNLSSRSRNNEFTSAYATHDRKETYNKPYIHPSFSQQLQPDFYFMPHQRRYSGEVVRVFVDYNNPQFTPK